MPKIVYSINKSFPLFNITILLLAILLPKSTEIYVTAKKPCNRQIGILKMYFSLFSSSQCSGGDIRVQPS